MKKIYMTPSMMVVNVKSALMLEASASVDPNAEHAQQGQMGAKNAFEYYYDEDEE